MGKVFIDNFSGEVSELKGKNRTDENVLAILKTQPLISTWEFSDNPWLCKSVERLKKDKKITELEQGYPWHKYKVII